MNVPSTPSIVRRMLAVLSVLPILRRMETSTPPRDTGWAMLQESLEDFIRCGYAGFNQAERETVDEQEPAHAQTAPR